MSEEDVLEYLRRVEEHSVEQLDFTLLSDFQLMTPVLYAFSSSRNIIFIHYKASAVIKGFLINTTLDYYPIHQEQWIHESNYEFLDSPSVIFAKSENQWFFKDVDDREDLKEWLDILAGQIEQQNATIKESISLPDIVPNSYAIKCFYNHKKSILQLAKLIPGCPQGSPRDDIDNFCRYTFYFLLPNEKTYQREQFLQPHSNSEIYPDDKEFITFTSLKTEHVNLTESCQIPIPCSSNDFSKRTDLPIPDLSTSSEEMIRYMQRKPAITMIPDRHMVDPLPHSPAQPPAPSTRKRKRSTDSDTLDTFGKRIRHRHGKNEAVYDQTDQIRQHEDTKKYLSENHPNLYNTLKEIEQLLENPSIEDNDETGSFEEKLQEYIYKALHAYQTMMREDKNLQRTAAVPEMTDSYINFLLEHPLCKFYYMSADRHPILWHDVINYLNSLSNTKGWGVEFTAHPQPNNTLNLIYKEINALLNENENENLNKTLLSRLDSTKEELIKQLKKSQPLSLASDNHIKQIRAILLKHKRKILSIEQEDTSESVVAYKIIKQLFERFDKPDTTLKKRLSSQDTTPRWFYRDYVDMANYLLGGNWFDLISIQWLPATQVRLIQSSKRVILEMTSYENERVRFKPTQAALALFTKKINLSALLKVPCFKRLLCIESGIDELRKSLEVDHTFVCSSGSLMDLHAVFFNASDTLQPLSEEEIQEIERSDHLMETTPLDSVTEERDSVEIGGETIDFSLL
ncbi:hypothetical protein [Endozoicomonas sp. Mp262]|uniref:hypothetical protein n=1 Tax=Endozoicomonas sp. Mp262 TaxID=2919499 RepID=UPI0021D94D3E